MDPSWSELPFNQEKPSIANMGSRHSEAEIAHNFGTLQDRINSYNNLVTTLPTPPGTQAIVNITCKDVVMGRGSGTQNHFGNVTYRKLVNLNKVCWSPAMIVFVSSFLIVLLLTSNNRSSMLPHRNSTSSKYQNPL